MLRDERLALIVLRINLWGMNFLVHPFQPEMGLTISRP